MTFPRNLFRNFILIIFAAARRNRLPGVARHNQMDLRGLAALFGKINALLSQESSAEEEMHGLDLFGLSNFCIAEATRDARKLPALRP